MEASYRHMNEAEPNLPCDFYTSNEIPQQFIENKHKLFNT